MEEGKETVIREFLIKDNENYNLLTLGFIQDIEEEIRFLHHLKDHIPFTTFSEWKYRLMNHYYEKRQFSSFIRSNTGNPLFIETIYQKTQNLVETKYRNNLPSEVDIYLTANRETLAYLLPYDLFLGYYHRFFTTDIRINTPTELYHYCTCITDNIFPLSCQEVLELVKNANPTFCSRISRWLNNLIRKDCPDRDDIHHEVYIAFIEAIRKNSLATPDKPRSIRNYAIGIINNKRREAQRRQKELVLREDQKLIPFFDRETTETDEQTAIKDKILEILQDPFHPLRKELLQGMEEKIDILMLHFTQGLSYEKIALQKYGTLPPDELKRATDKFRQDICRIKTPLRSRIKKIIPKL